MTDQRILLKQELQTKLESLSQAESADSFQEQLEQIFKGEHQLSKGNIAIIWIFATASFLASAYIAYFCLKLAQKQSQQSDKSKQQRSDLHQQTSQKQRIDQNYNQSQAGAVEQKNVYYVDEMESQEDLIEESDKLSSQTMQIKGLKYKKVIFKSLAIVTLIRAFSFLIQLWQNADSKWCILIKQMSLDLPTLLTISTFSVFVCYLALLNSEIELHLIGYQRARPVGSQFTITFLLIGNLCLYVFYFVCFAQYAEDLGNYDKQQVVKLHQWTKTFTGMGYLVLGLAILKNGARLETTVSHALTAQQTQPSSSNPDKTGQNNNTTETSQPMTTNSNMSFNQNTEKYGEIDIRILSITILLSLVFLCRALIDCMFAFNLITDNLDNQVLTLVVIFVCEVVTSVSLVKIMQKRKTSTHPQNSSQKTAADGSLISALPREQDSSLSERNGGGNNFQNGFNFDSSRNRATGQQKQPLNKRQSFDSHMVNRPNLQGTSMFAGGGFGVNYGQAGGNGGQLMVENEKIRARQRQQQLDEYGTFNSNYGKASNANGQPGSSINKSSTMAATVVGAWMQNTAQNYQGALNETKFDVFSYLNAIKLGNQAENAKNAVPAVLPVAQTTLTLDKQFNEPLLNLKGDQMEMISPIAKKEKIELPKTPSSVVGIDEKNEDKSAEKNESDSNLEFASSDSD